MSAEESLATQGIPSEGDGLRLSFWKVGMVLLVLVVVVLGGAFALNSQLRSRVGIEPVSTALPAAQVETSASAATVEARSLHQEVMDAYLLYWEVRKDAFRSLEPGRLSEVMAGDALARDVKQIQDLKAQARAVEVVVEHSSVLVEAGLGKAVVYDEYLNQSLFIDLTTGKEMQTAEPPGVEKISYEMTKADGVWKVVDSARHP